MRKKLSGAAPIVATTLVAITLVAITFVAIGAAVLTPVSPASAQAPATPGAPAPSLKTPWGEPDLDGVTGHAAAEWLCGGVVAPQTDGV